MATILLIETDERTAQVVRESLQHAYDLDFQFEWVRSCAEGLARLVANGQPLPPTPVCAILVNLHLPDLDGIPVVDRLGLAAPQVPLIVLCDDADVPLARNAIQHGAQDFLLRERLDDYLLPKVLLAAIGRATAANALHEERDRAQVTLNSIGDAVISTDAEGKVAFVNVMAERMTGWPMAEAIGHPVEDVLQIIDEHTRLAIPDPMARATRMNATVGLPKTTLLVHRDGSESPIEDSAAPIHGRGDRIAGAVMVFHDVTGARTAANKLTHLASHDSLTGLPNRMLLNDRLAQAIVQAHRDQRSLALLYLDLDRFKLVNDSLGHLVGDHLLGSVAARLAASVRESDSVCRLGGDEFVMLLPELASSGDAANCAEKILQALALPHLVDGHELHADASIGIAVYPGDGSDAETLLHNADSAMYEAKALGRNRYQFYRPELNAHAIERQALESALRHAIDRGELSLQYQPIIDLASRTVAGVEALVRWRHPTQGPVTTARAVAIAEESGLIVRIGQWVLREACRQAAAWQAAGLRLPRLAVNISAVELRSPTFVFAVAAILQETGFNPACLELELTETFLMEDVHSTSQVLSALRELGIRIALDDFGTGYSSLSYLRRFPIDTLKVDRSFVRDLCSDPADASVVSAVINMGRSLHMRVVAEGVETAEQLAFLQAQGCQEAQGYFFSRPLDAAACAALLPPAAKAAAPTATPMAAPVILLPWRTA